MKHYKTALTIAGSDPSGGAGIQADLKTFFAHECYGMSVITALTAQNTKGVTAIHPLPSEFICQQLTSVLEDIKVNAIKIGMLNSVENIQTIADVLKNYRDIPIVLDPVMIAKSGHRLLKTEAVKVLKEKLLPLATILTPNIPEAEDLLEVKIKSQQEMENAAKQLSLLGPKAVLIKGGHLENKTISPDCLYVKKNNEIIWLEQNRINTKNTHGTGCTLSSAIASNLAHKKNIIDAIKLAKDFISKAIVSGSEYKIGQGHGPVNHFVNIDQ